jgi:hypothetical protein
LPRQKEVVPARRESFATDVALALSRINNAQYEQGRKQGFHAASQRELLLSWKK